MRKFKPGAKMIADKSKLCVQPIVLVNTSRYYNIKKKHYSPGRITAVILESFIADKSDKEWLNNLRDTMQKVYDEEVAKIFGLEEGQMALMIHTGSRGFGHQVATDYIKLMRDNLKAHNADLPDKQLINAPFEHSLGQDYFSAMACAANYAFANRQIITYWVRESFKEVFKMDPEKLDLHLIYDVCHNVAKVEEHEVNGKRVKLVVHRKGATRAYPPGHPDIPNDHKNVGQVVLIPGSMGTASYVMVGIPEGSLTWYSAPHGAGRLLSRAEAIRMYRPREVIEELRKMGIDVRAATMRVVAEEAPGSYKDVDAVAHVAHEVNIAKLVVRLRPIGVVKG